jgi:hypothetical protein
MKSRRNSSALASISRAASLFHIGNTGLQLSGGEVLPYDNASSKSTSWNPYDVDIATMAVDSRRDISSRQVLKITFLPPYGLG